MDGQFHQIARNQAKQARLRKAAKMNGRIVAEAAKTYLQSNIDKAKFSTTLPLFE